MKKIDESRKRRLTDVVCFLLALAVIVVCALKVLLRNIIWIKFPVIFALGIAMNALLSYRNYRRYHKHYRMFMIITVVLVVVFAAVTFG